jgi:hypothetical protein
MKTILAGIHKSRCGDPAHRCSSHPSVLIHGHLRLIELQRVLLRLRRLGWMPQVLALLLSPHNFLNLLFGQWHSHLVVYKNHKCASFHLLRYSAVCLFF